MEFTHLQFNTELLKSPTDVANMLSEYDVDFACLQEIYYDIDNGNPLPPLIEEKGLEYVESVNYVYLPKNLETAVAVVSKYPIVDYHVHYFNPYRGGPRTVSMEDLVGEVIGDPMKAEFPTSRAAYNSVLSFGVQSVLLDVNGQYVRMMNSHFPVSDLCVESTEIYQLGLIVSSVVKYSADVPTIFSGDLNIHSKSRSVEVISKVLDHHTKDLTNTLADDHPARKGDAPDGLAVDHVFSKHFTHKDTEVIETGFSDHKALVSKFEL